MKSFIPWRFYGLLVLCCFYIIFQWQSRLAGYKTVFSTWSLILTSMVLGFRKHIKNLWIWVLEFYKCFNWFIQIIYEFYMIFQCQNHSFVVKMNHLVLETIKGLKHVKLKLNGKKFLIYVFFFFLYTFLLNQLDSYKFMMIFLTA